MGLFSTTVVNSVTQVNKSNNPTLELANIGANLDGDNSIASSNSGNTGNNVNDSQVKKLLKELEPHIFKTDWLTIGIMAPCDNRAIESLQSISKKYASIKFGNLDSLHADGCVFLKANQKTGNVFVRSENGLGEGILITCQYDEDAKGSNTFGPFPLDFFR